MLSSFWGCSLLYIFAVVVVLDRLYDGRQRVLLVYSFACPCSGFFYGSVLAVCFFLLFSVYLFFFLTTPIIVNCNKT
jgi:hypothetical protein